MNGKALDPLDCKAMTFEQLTERREREITQVLMIDRVELAAIDQVFNIRHFDDRNAFRFQQETQALNKSIEIRDVGQARCLRESHLRVHPVQPGERRFRRQRSP